MPNTWTVGLNLMFDQAGHLFVGLRVCLFMDYVLSVPAMRLATTRVTTFENGTTNVCGYTKETDPILEEPNPFMEILFVAYHVVCAKVPATSA